MTKEQEKTLEQIQAILKETGDFSPIELKAPYIDLFPNCASTKKVIHIGEDDVTIGIFLDGTQIDTDDIEYKELVEIAPEEVDVLGQILALAEERKVDLDNTMERCRDYNY